MKFFPSVIPPVYTDGHIQSVFTDGMIDGIFRIKKKRFPDVEVFTGDFTNRITEGFKMAALYGDVTDSPFEMPMESPRDSNRNLYTVTCPVYRQNGRRTHRRNNFVSESVSKSSHFADPLLLYFSFFFPILTLPYCKQLAPQKKISLFSAQQVIFLKLLKFCGHSIRVLIYRWILSIFVSNSIFLNFNI
jgi:hypothetical protein